jgi:hypothetical protein
MPRGTRSPTAYVTRNRSGSSGNEAALWDIALATLVFGSGARRIEESARYR